MGTLERPTDQQIQEAMNVLVDAIEQHNVSPAAAIVGCAAISKILQQEYNVDFGIVDVGRVEDDDGIAH